MGGVPVRLHPSALVMLALVASVFLGRYGPSLSSFGVVATVGAVLSTSLLALASVVIHELGHALTSVDRNIPVVGITLFALGGVTESTREPQKAAHEFVVVGIGPFLSLVLAAVFGLLYTVAAGYRPLAIVAGYLAWANFMLALFNIVPGYPLDGGRLLRSILWAVTGRRHRATRWAARVGQVFASSLIALGAWFFLRTGGDGFAGLWEVLVGFFLLRGATDAYRRASLQERLGNRPVRQVMGTAPPALPAEVTLADAVSQVQERPSLLWPVGTPVQGGLTLAQIDTVPNGDWNRTRAADIAFPADDVIVGADSPLDEALDRLAESPGNMLLVTDDGGAVVGLLTPSLVSGMVAGHHR
jgi:Zn-dependent protease